MILALDCMGTVCATRVALLLGPVREFDSSKLVQYWQRDIA